MTFDGKQPLMEDDLGSNNKLNQQEPQLKSIIMQSMKGFLGARAPL